MVVSGHYKSVKDFDSSASSNQHRRPHAPRSSSHCLVLRFRFGATDSNGAERLNLDLASTMLLHRQAIDTVANFSSLVDTVRCCTTVATLASVPLAAPLAAPQ